MQHATAKAYGTVAQQIANPRDLEATLLLKAAARLQAVHENWDTGDTRQSLANALTYNRKLWTIFVSAVTDSNHPLPPEIRQNIANLGIFVLKQTLTLVGEPSRDRLPSLININREIAAGLRGQG